MMWENLPDDARVAFEACVERTAFANSLRFLEHLRRFPLAFNLSPTARARDLIDYRKLVHMLARHAAAENLTSEKLRQSQYDSSEAEKAFDWTAWVCLHFHTDAHSPPPRSLGQGADSALYDNWAAEALRYAEMGKARGIGDSLRKQQPGILDNNPEIGLEGDKELLSDLPSWLDPETLVIHLTLIHEGLGAICIDTSGIPHAQCSPGFGTWDAMSLNSSIFGTIEHPNFAGDLDDNPDPQARVRTKRRGDRIQRAIAKLSAALISPISHLLLQPSSSSSSSSSSRLHAKKRLCFIPAGLLTRTFAVYSAPSLSVLKMLSQSAKQHPPPSNNKTIVVIAAHDDNDPLLPNAAECVDAAAQFGPQQGLLVSASTLDKAGMLDLLARHDFVHIGAHGTVKYDRPLASRIRLRPGNEITVADLHDARSSSRARLVFFSACLVALGHSSMTDDMTGFPTAVLASGALAFAGSLWSAHAVAALFFAHFLYEELLAGSQKSGSLGSMNVERDPEAGGRSLVDALAQARRRLRRLDREEAGEIVEKMQKRWESSRDNGQGLPDDGSRDVARFFEQYHDKNARDNFVNLYFWAPFVLVGYSHQL
ncbi:CHAT domain-containing protein [Podospora didyma]|uniref:CHAT domain-containing protein n=1 Tax=Podospora didyma TaxID=330526 RepID=A0AAE0NCG7_9PEZI|nr:CHAT domain-containing protein [Podospora didyma]